MEFRGSTQPTSGPCFGLPPSTPPELVRLAENLDNRAVQSGERLALRLRRALTLHDLDREELLAAQRDVTRLQRIGAVPAPNDYWQRTALPRAAKLIDASLAAVVEEGHQLGRAIDDFLVAVDEHRAAFADALSASPAATAGPSRNRPEFDQASIDVAERAIVPLLQAVPPNRSIDALGAWWQRRLRRAAIIAALPRLLISDDADRLIGQAEMSLLDRPPWSHGDRLLSAFELAHGEIRTQTELVADGLSSRIAARGRRYLTPGERVTIELRN